jgi:hypothetical protein
VLVEHLRRVALEIPAEELGAVEDLRVNGAALALRDFLVEADIDRLHDRDVVRAQLDDLCMTVGLRDRVVGDCLGVGVLDVVLVATPRAIVDRAVELVRLADGAAVERIQAKHLDSGRVSRRERALDIGAVDGNENDRVGVCCDRLTDVLVVDSRVVLTVGDGHVPAH